MTELQNVGIWLRVSPSMRETESIEHHRERALAYAKSQGLKVVREYDLSNVSGRDVLNSEQGKQMMADIKAGVIDGLIFSTLFRLGRNTRQLLDIAEFFREHNAALISLDQKFDTSTPAGMIFYTIIAAIGQGEREETGKRVSDSIPIRAKLGKNTGGPAPFGYQWEQNRLILKPDEAPIVKLMFELYRESQCIMAVARELNEQGHRTRRGGLWGDSAVRHCLLDARSMGKRKTNYTTAKTRLINGKQSKPQSEWIEQKIPAIVSKKLWNQCQQIHTENRPAKKQENLFTGLLVCGCGSKMYADTNRFKKYRCGSCKASIHASVIEDVFEQHVWQLINDGKETGFNSRIEAELAAKYALLERHKKALAKIEAQLKKLNQDYLSHELSARRFESLADEAERSADKLKKEISAVRGAIDALDAQRLDSDQTVHELRSVLIRWSEFGAKEKNLFVREIVESLEYRDGAIYIDLCLPSATIFRKYQTSAKS